MHDDSCEADDHAPHPAVTDRAATDHAVTDRPVTDRVAAALQLAGAAGAAVAAAPLLTRVGAADLFDLRGAEPALASRLNWPVPPIVTRAQWGANESLRKPGRIYNPTVTKIIVHHTGTPNSITDYPGLARSILSHEVNTGYIDVAYNWLIDPLGRIYEGRWAQAYPGVPHTGESSGKNVQGAHALHFNVNTIGIGLMGDYSGIGPSAAMVEALTTLMTWKCARWGIDPLGATTYFNSQGARVVGLRNICGHRDTYATACPGATVEAMLPGLRVQVASRIAIGATGYWIATGLGEIVAFGNLPNAGSTLGKGLNAPIVGIAGHPSGQGYWLLGRDGGVFTFGAARFYGSTGNLRLNQPIVGMASTVTGKGYWLVASDGGVFCFGDARFYGSTGALRLKSPVLGLTPTSTGKGYWLYARDGGIFSFGDARFYGSTGAMRLNRPVVGMAAPAERRLLDGRGRRWHLQLRPRAVLRLGRQPAAFVALRRDGRVDNGSRLRVAPGRRIGVAVRRRAVPRRCQGPHLRPRGRSRGQLQAAVARRSARRVRGQVESSIHVAAETVVGVERRAHLAPVVEPRVHGGQHLGAHARVLGEVHAPARVDDELVEAVERSMTRARRHVECERPTRGREAEETAAVVLEALQDREERRALVRAESLENRADDRLLAVGHDELVLHEAVRSVDPVPIEHEVEQVEEGGDALYLTAPLAWRVAEPQLVERADRERIEQAVGDPRRRAEQGARRELPHLIASTSGGRRARRGSHA